MHFSQGRKCRLSGELRAKNQGIDRCLHWSMDATYVASGHDSNLRFAGPYQPLMCMGRAWEVIGYSLPTQLSEADKTPSPPK